MHRTIKYTFLGLILLISQYACSQQLSFKQYKIQDGLSSMMQYAILQDRQGFIWTCNDAGMTRFDGKKFIHITVKDGLPDNEILTILEDSKGRIWYTCLKGNVGYIKNLKINKLESLNKLLGEQHVNSISEDCSGNILLGTYNGLLKLSGNLEMYTVLSGPMAYRKLFFDCSKNTIIDISAKNSVEVIQNKLRSTITLKNLPKSPFSVHNAGTNYKDHYCIFTDGHFVASLDSSLQTKILIYDNILKENTIISLYADKDKNIWVGTYKGLFYYRYSNNTYHYNGHYLADKKISCIFADTENNIWISTLGEGLFQMLSNKIFTINKENGLSDNSIHCILQVNNKFYIGSEKGYLNVVNTSNLEVEHIYTVNVKEKNQTRVLQLSKYNNKLLIASDDGLFVFNQNETAFLNSKDFDATRAIKDIYCRDENNLVIGEAGGIIYKSHINNKYNSLIKYRTSSVFEDKDSTIWFSDDKGLGYIKKDIFYRKLDHKHLLSERILQIRQDFDGGLWLATQGKGIIYLKGDSTVNITSADGLASDICNSFLIEKNKIWVATNEGISKITFASNDKKKFSIQNITSTQGLPSDKIFAVVKDGAKLYVASNNGLTYFNEDDVIPNNIPPPVYISGVKIWEKDTTIAGNYELSYNMNNIKIEFTGLSYKSLGNIKYRYKIEGLDTNWITTSYNVASYPSLPAGKYRFLVKAINDNNVESKTAASISIVVYPPFWLTTWCKCLVTILLLLIVIVIYYFRLKRIRAKNALQNQIMEAEQYALRAQMNPHFVFNALNSIQRFMLQKDPLMANEYLSKFGNLIRRIFENSMHAYIPINDEIETLKLYIQIESLRFDNAFEYHLIVDEDLDKYNIEIPPMIIQPYVENAIWHGLLHKPEKGMLTVEVKKLPGKIVCIVEDNGIGQKKSASLKTDTSGYIRNSAGMSITEKRLQNLTELTQKVYTVTATDLFDDSGNPTGTRIIIEFSEL